MNLPRTCQFGDVLDVIFRSLLENLVFLSSCNVVHRDCELSRIPLANGLCLRFCSFLHLIHSKRSISALLYPVQSTNILCDGLNQRLRLANFGNAVDLDPPRVGLDNDSLELDTPGSVADTLAADVFSVALIVCQLLFDAPDVEFHRPLKDAVYDLDLWLKRAVVDDLYPKTGNALEYLRKRPGLWGLLKTALRPNPLRKVRCGIVALTTILRSSSHTITCSMCHNKKITSNSLSEFNQIMACKAGELVRNEEDRIRIAREETFLLSLISPSSESFNEVQEIPLPETTPEERDDQEVFDITRQPYKLQPHKQRAKPTPSALSRLQRKAEEAAALSRTNKTEESVTEIPPMRSNSEKSFSITHQRFSPIRESSLTHMLDEYAKKTSRIARDPFQIIMPQPTEPRTRVLSTMPPSKTLANAMEGIQISCPRGKLGVVIDTPLSGGPAYVCDVSDDSPLFGLIGSGDRILAVDDMDVRELVADDVIDILLDKSNNAVRIITIMHFIEEDVALLDDTSKSSSNAAVADATQSFTYEKSYKEVKQWLQQYLPLLQKEDAFNYCKYLVDDGFDCLGMLDEVLEEDLYFMKKGHRRVLARQLFGITSDKTRTLPTMPSDEPSPAEKIYTLDEALGEAARRGIEAKIMEEKRKSSTSSGKKK